MEVDPRLWEIDLPWRPIWLSPAENLFCIVSLADYDWALQWQWRPKWNSRGKKVYAVRGATSIFMHKAITIRHHGPRPTRARKIADHRNGQSLDNRDFNLRWVTPRMNNLNLFGKDAHDRRLQLPTSLA